MAKIEHNVVVVNDKEYKAVQSKAACLGCDFSNKSNCTQMSISCTSRSREDGCDVIYKPHYKLGGK